MLSGRGAGCHACSCSHITRSLVPHVSHPAVQVPQFVLEQAVLSGQGAGCHVIVAQPRRIAAISVAERVAVERGEKGERFGGF
jgi:hypothetical protein